MNEREISTKQNSYIRKHFIFLTLGVITLAGHLVKMNDNSKNIPKNSEKHGNILEFPLPTERREPLYCPRNKK